MQILGGGPVEIRNKVIDHFFASSKSSSIDPRYEGTFGLALYGVSLFIEIIFYRASLSITGRVALRALVETYITFKYLLKKEKTEKEVWSDYRGYGTGQLKLLYLKLVELGKEIGSIEVDTLDELANEDKSVEFTPIHIGHWDSANLRKISEEIGAKDLYDTYYGYTSGFMHASWSAVRESVYQRCLNPLHRLHRVPTYDLPLMPSVTKDAREIVNMILGCLHEAYPKFDYRFTEIDDKLKDMKTILVDAVDCFVIEETDGSFKIFKEMQELLDSLPNTKIILTGANDEQFKRFGLDKMPYEVFTLKHNPEKTESKYFSMMLDHLKLSKQGVVYFEHNPDAVKSAQSVGIKTYFYDNSKKDLVSLKKFIEENA